MAPLTTNQKWRHSNISNPIFHLSSKTLIHIQPRNKQHTLSDCDRTFSLGISESDASPTTQSSRYQWPQRQNKIMSSSLGNTTNHSQWILTQITWPIGDVPRLRVPHAARWHLLRCLIRIDCPRFRFRDHCAIRDSVQALQAEFHPGTDSGSEKGFAH